MREAFLGVGFAVLVGLAGGAMMKPDLVPALTRDGSMSPVEPTYSYDDAVSYAPSSAPVYYDSWASADQAALLRSASYDISDDAGGADVPRYDPRPAPEDRAQVIRDATLQDNVQAPAPDETTARYPSADGDILAGLTPSAPIPPLPPTASPAPTPFPVPTPPADDGATGDTRTVVPHAPS